jgi:hypothetical protein
MRSRLRFSPSVWFALALAAAPGALAQSRPPPPPPDDDPPASSARHPNGEYTAPLSQPTQPSYVPQSVALSGPETIDDWDENRPVPAGYHPEKRKRKGLIISGSILLGASYLIAAFAASVASDVKSNNSNNNSAALYLPVFGPFIQTSNWTSSTGRFFLVVDGGCQAAGFAMLLSGLLAEKTILVRNDFGATLLPIRTRDGGSGLALFARF